MANCVLNFDYWFAFLISWSSLDFVQIFLLCHTFLFDLVLISCYRFIVCCFIQIFQHIYYLFLISIIFFAPVYVVSVYVYLYVELKNITLNEKKPDVHIKHIRYNVIYMKYKTDKTNSKVIEVKKWLPLREGW